MNKVKIGLLPLYIKLYDDAAPHMRKELEAFYQTVTDELVALDVTVIPSAFCRIESEFETAVRTFEEQDADAIVTLHMAYSPSLESAKVLAGTHLPIVVLDTTPTYDFSALQSPEQISYNHGIHGVQDMCNLLIRNGKPFHIEAGHYRMSDVLKRTVDRVNGLYMAKRHRSARLGMIGLPFDGMGDFHVPIQTMQENLNVSVIQADMEKIRELRSQVEEKRIEQEMQEDRQRFVVGEVNPNIHRLSVHTGLAIRDWIDQNDIHAFSINFMNITKDSGLCCMPFLEISKAMARGIGYAGEGDILTASLTGALLSRFPRTSFVEMFCPDWKHDAVFLSHMGEMNFAVAADRPVLTDKPFPYTDAGDTMAAYARFQGGDAVFVNLAPIGNGRYRLIMAQGHMEDDIECDRFEQSIRGWFSPNRNLARFLEDYSKVGGTHHAVMVYGQNKRALITYGEAMGFEVVDLSS